MDQVTQMLLGGAVAQAAVGRRLGRTAGLVGAAAGLVPDGDLLLAALADTRFPVELHRTFTHGLPVAPLVALATALPFLLVPPLRRRWPWVLLAALMGALTHAPLDACTSYGTQLLWPFDTAWVAWDVIAIVDPFFSLPLLVGFAWALLRGRPRPARIALVLAGLYLVFGALQRERALDAQARLIAHRGHEAEHRRVIPVLGSVLLWRSLYRTETEIHADGLRLLPFREPEAQAAGALPRFGTEDLPPAIASDAGAAALFARFVRFADGFTARMPADPAVVADMRYTASWGFDAAWGMRVAPPAPLAWWDGMQLDEATRARLAGKIFGTAGAFRPLPPATEAP